MNVAIYLRKSRADENNPLETLERHKEILLSYAKDNNLTVIVQKYPKILLLN